MRRFVAALAVAAAVVTVGGEASADWPHEKDPAPCLTGTMSPRAGMFTAAEADGSADVVRDLEPVDVAYGFPTLVRVDVGGWAQTFRVQKVMHSLGGIRGTALSGDWFVIRAPVDQGVHVKVWAELIYTLVAYPCPGESGRVG